MRPGRAGRRIRQNRQGLPQLRGVVSFERILHKFKGRNTLEFAGLGLRRLASVPEGRAAANLTGPYTWPARRKYAAPRIKTVCSDARRRSVDSGQRQSGYGCGFAAMHSRPASGIHARLRRLTVLDLAASSF
jgi:hypothetical protein